MSAIDNIRVIRVPVNELTPEQKSQWRSIAGTRPGLDSPFLDPMFADSMAAVRSNVSVLVMEIDSKAAGFLPLYQHRPNRSQALAYELAAVQAFIGEPGCSAKLGPSLATLGIRSWRYNHLVECGVGIETCSWVREQMPFIDISEGFARYRSQRRRAGSQQLEQVLRKERNLQRDFGDVRFELHDPSPEAFNRLLEWKSEQRRITRSRNVLDQVWVRDLIRHLSLVDTPEFGGVQSVLYVADEIAAVHFGVRTGKVLHWWFPTYDPRFARYSPGLVLLAALTRDLAGRRFARIDLGAGGSRYKTSLMTGSKPLAEGAVGYGAVARALGSVWAKLRYRARHSRLQKEIARTKHLLRSWRG